MYMFENVPRKTFTLFVDRSLSTVLNFKIITLLLHNIYMYILGSSFKTFKTFSIRARFGINGINIDYSFADNCLVMQKNLCSTLVSFVS